MVTIRVAVGFVMRIAIGTIMMEAMMDVGIRKYTGS